MTGSFDSAESYKSADDRQEPVVLRDWTAQDFSNLYVKYYPVVLRHARKFLTNFAQAEEVTQDSFLYLMTSLPEVDSEIGVLKILKWKTRLLALDVIASNQGAPLVHLEDKHEGLTNTPELSLQLERADDAAIVALALAKIEPRQREALVASLYEEKSRSEVASQLGITENAAKQLVYRAKSSFRKALIGEAETSGLSISQILSVAARRASQNSMTGISAASGLVLVLALITGTLPLPGQIGVDEPLAFEPLISTDLFLESLQPQPKQYAKPDPLNELVADGVFQNSRAQLPTAAYADGSGSLTVAKGGPVLTSETNTDSGESIPQPEVRPASLSPYLGLSVRQAEIARGATPFFPNSTTVLKIHSGVGLWAYVDLDAENMSANAVGFEIMVDGKLLYASARSFGTATTSSSVGHTLTYSATELFLIDEDKNVISEQAMANSFVTIMIQFDTMGNPTGADLFVTS